MAWKSKKHQKKADKARWRRNRDNVDFKLIKNLRHSVRKASKEQGVTPIADPFSYLGCTLEEFKEYLNEMFYTAAGCYMTWTNYGGKEGWQIDHIQPLSSFDLSDLDDFKTACFFGNLQPLWKSHNQEKGIWEGEWIHPEERSAPF